MRRTERAARRGICPPQVAFRVQAADRGSGLRIDMKISGRTQAKIAVGSALVAVVAAIYLSPLRNWLTAENLSGAISRIASLWYAPFVFMAAFAIACVLWIPASVFLIAAGVIWGWKLGSLYSIVGAIAGAVLSYYVSRFLGADAMGKLGTVVSGYVHRYLGIDLLSRFGGGRIERYLDHAGFQTMLILRLIPLFPFAVLNYGAGFARVRARDFLFSTAIGIVPSMIVVCYCADAIAHGMMSQEDALKNLLKVGFVLAVAVAVPLVLKKRAAKALKIEVEGLPGSER